MSEFEQNGKELNRVSEVINIGSWANDETERMMSNFSDTPFWLNGKWYASVEGFWQGLKFPEGSKKREEVSGLIGGKAKKAGMKASASEEFSFEEKQIKVGSTEHHKLMRQAIRAKLEQNPEVLKLLLATGDKGITHILKRTDGTLVPDSKSIPGAKFSQILMDLRTEFQKLIAAAEKESPQFNLADYLNKIKNQSTKMHQNKIPLGKPNRYFVTLC